MSEDENRRPLKARSWKLIEQGASWLSQKNITPNQISVLSIGFAFLIFCFLLMIQKVSGFALWFIVLLCLICMLGRALCNIFDGMIAIEGGKNTRTGEMFNDFPDRIADALILIGAGYAALMPIAGWLAALLAVMTAYVRVLTKSIGAPADFRGPMAKVARMALVTAGFLIMPIEALYIQKGTFLSYALIIIIAGCILTMWNRAKAAYEYLEKEA